MIHVLTVHWKDARWIDIQLRYLSKHIQHPFQVYAFLNELPESHNHKFFYASTESIVSHAVKLNVLADMAAFNSDDDQDMLMFIDGDAFPIGDVLNFSQNILLNYPLAAVQRKENIGDIQPHPSFCITTVRFWKEIGGDWKQGYHWEDGQGKPMTDVGGNLLGTLREKNIDWYPMLRSNTKNLHPMFYGIYENLIYHHGAGFRNPASRIDKLTGLNSMERLVFQFQTQLPKGSLTGKVLYRLYDPARRMKLRNQVVAQQIFEKIENDPLFYREFVENL